MTGIVATATIDIDASPDRVWTALTEPAMIKKYMFGTQVTTDWQVGSTIVWQGTYEDKPYQDKGEILEVEAQRRLSMTHFSPLTGQDDVPENYHTLTYDLEPRGNATRVLLSQDNNGSDDEAQRAKTTWETLLAGMKDVVEAG